jgi:hypothetical protein
MFLDIVALFSAMAFANIAESDFKVKIISLFSVMVFVMAAESDFKIKIDSFNLRRDALNSFLFCAFTDKKKQQRRDKTNFLFIISNLINI